MLLPACSVSVQRDLVSTLFPYTTLFRSSVAVLSEVSGSNTPEVVLAVLEMLVVREESTLTTRVDRKSTRLNSSHMSNSTTAACREKQPVAETKLVPAGMASDRLTPVASDGPLFVTVSV